MNTKKLLGLAVALGMGALLFSWGSGHRLGSSSIHTSSRPIVEALSIVGTEKTEGEATAWNNAGKLAVDSQGHIHIVYQYERSDRRPGKLDLLRYVKSEDGQTWHLEEWPGRYATIAVDDRDRVYMAYVERTPQSDRLWLRLRDSAAGWTTRLLVENPPRSLFYPTLKAGAQALHMAWEAHTSEGHGIHYAALPFHSDGAPTEFHSERVTSHPQGVYFANVALDGDGRVHVMWEAARDLLTHQIEAAVRLDSGWQLYPNISNDVGDARYPALSSRPDGRLQAVFVTHEEGLRSSLYTAIYDLDSFRWENPQRLVRQGPEEHTAGYAQKLLAFPVTTGEYALWGTSVPAACGAGPLSFSSHGDAGWSPPQELLGEFASYPHLIEKPRGVLHLAWTDRDAQKLRAFVVRYARLFLP